MDALDKSLNDLLALDLEYRLTVAIHLHEDCECSTYLIRRREVLIPAVLKQAEATDTDPIDVFAEFARGVHSRSESGVRLVVPV